MRLANEFAVFCTITWFASDILKYYGGIYFRQRKSMIKFMPKDEFNMLKESNRCAKVNGIHEEMNRYNPINDSPQFVS